MFNVFTGSSRLDAIISFGVRKHRLALAPITNYTIEHAMRLKQLQNSEHTCNFSPT